MRRVLAIFVLCVLGVPAQAEEPVEIPLVEAPVLRKLEIAPQVSVVSISALSLPVPGYDVRYVPAIEGLPALQLVVTRSLVDWGRLTFAAQGMVGFGSRSGAFTTLQAANSSLSPENITLHWIPSVVSTRISYRGTEFPSLRPSITLGVGALTLMQSAENAALNRTIGIPIWVLSAQLSFLDSASRHWLGGFSFGFSLMRGLGGDSRLAATSLDLSINLLP